MRGQSAIKAHKPKRFYQWANLELCGFGPARNTFHIEWSRRLKIESFTQRKKIQRTGGSTHWEWRDKIWRSGRKIGSGETHSSIQKCQAHIWAEIQRNKNISYAAFFDPPGGLPSQLLPIGKSPAQSGPSAPLIHALLCLSPSAVPSTGF